MNLDTALAAHTEWKTKLRSAISAQSSLDAGTIARDDCCAFGKWLHGEARAKYGSLQSYRDCISKHAAFHLEAGKVASIINQKQFHRAEAALGSGSPYTNASNAVGMSIIQLRKSIAA